MDNAQYNLCCEVLRRLHREKVLNHMVLIGSWCLLAYADYFKPYTIAQAFEHAISTF